MLYFPKEASVPYREKTAWLSLLAMAAGFLPYFYTVSHLHPPSATPIVQALTLFLAAVIRQILVLIVGHVALRFTSPEDAKAPADERDRDFQRRSVVAAYYVLLTSMIVVGCVMPMNRQGWDIFNAAVFAIVVAETVHYGATAWFYRRQA
jgi:hypothetical protein